jgi:hypothetical protein
MQIEVPQWRPGVTAALFVLELINNFKRLIAWLIY